MRYMKHTTKYISTLDIVMKKIRGTKRCIFDPRSSCRNIHAECRPWSSLQLFLTFVKTWKYCHQKQYLKKNYKAAYVHSLLVDVFQVTVNFKVCAVSYTRQNNPSMQR